ncbi:MAG: rhodanese-like domain-containing protein [Rhodomicrobium sp.]|nr:rhodanese-like domain-containing protein [Rhodomicrobium sp.]
MSVRTVGPATVKSWLDAGEAVLVDVREPREYASVYIEGSVPVPLGSIHCDALPDHSGRKLVVLCQMGGRSWNACRKLSGQMSGVPIYNLEGGILAWMRAGLPVQRPERTPSPSGDGSRTPLIGKLMLLMRLPARVLGLRPAGK